MTARNTMIAGRSCIEGEADSAPIPFLRMFGGLVSCLLMVAWAVASPGRALYVVQGCPVGEESQRFSARLSVLVDGELRPIREILSAKEGTAAVLSYPGQRLIILVPGGYFGQADELQISLVEMDEPETARTVALTLGTGEFVSDFHLVVSDSGDPQMLFGLRRGTESAGYRLLDIGSGESQQALSSERGDVFLLGTQGVGLPYDYLRVMVRDGRLFLGADPINVPPLTGKESRGQSNGGLVVRNAQYAAFVETHPTSELLSRSSGSVWIHSDRATGWFEVKIPGSPLSARPFGIWLAGFVIRVIDRDAPPPAPDPSIPRSPNCDPARWRLFRQDCTAPGILYLLNTRTQDLVTWKTGEADSEVVLVADREVLYRVGTRLYRATIAQSALGPPELVIDSMEVLDLHWAFWGPEPSFPANGNAQ